jgi:hypothetical protein
MYMEIAKTYEIKNSLLLVYLRDKLIDLNKSNPDFTVIPIKIETNPDEEIIYGVNKYYLHTYLFNKTCLCLG